MKNLVFALGVVLLLPPLTQANCGLDHCPRLAPGETSFDNSVSLQVKTVAFNLDSVSGNYQELQARYEYLGIHHWVFGGTLPVIALTALGETRYGISNPLLFASWYSRLNSEGMVYLGMQLELPFGNADEGMATDHLMLVPYALIEQSFGSGYLLGSFGYSHAIALHHHEDGEHPLFVNPHEDQEILFRAGTGFRALDNKLTPQLSLNGGYAVVDELEGEGRAHLTAEISLAYKALPNLVLTPSLELPLNSPKRFDWSGGLEIKGLF